MTLFCDYCNRVCDDRCELCKYKDEATPIEPGWVGDKPLNREEVNNEKDQANNS